MTLVIDRDEPKRLCKEVCKTFSVSSPINKGMYITGHARCVKCDVWTNHTGCHMLGGLPATPNSFGWYCNCCNSRVRQRPRTTHCKNLIRERMERAGKRVAY